MESCVENCIGLESSDMHGFGDEQDSRETQNSLSSKNDQKYIWVSSKKTVLINAVWARSCPR